VTIDDSLEAVPELKDLYRSSEHSYYRTLLDTARALEGVAQHASTHAAGVVISDVPLSEYAPLHRSTHGEGAQVTQYPMEAVARIGLLKMDFLGLATLTVMRRACDLIKRRHGVDLNILNIPLDDPAIYELLSTGEVTGLFQVESPGMRRVLRSLQPTCIEDVTAVVALYRPGPMGSIPNYVERKHGREEVTYLHPKLEPILRDTYGVLVYQEQIIQILSEIAGYNASDADLVRRAVGKKKKEALLSHREDFIRGAVAHGGVGEEVAGQIFDLIEWFARYGFNKAHAADYAVITCQTAYLKAKYPLEFMTATLSVERSNLAKLAIMIAETRRLGIELLPPDVNYSGVDFAVEGDGIRYGLGAIKNVGDGAVEPIVRERDARGPFSSLDDLVERVDLRLVTRRALESLIKVGALDRFGERNHLLEAIDRMLAMSGQSAEARAVGQITMFDAGSFVAPSLSILKTVPAPPAALRKHTLAWEKELSGTWLSEHPLNQALARLKGMDLTATTDITEELRDQRVTLLGTVARSREIQTKKRDLMAFVTVEDLHGAIEVVVFPRTYKETKELWKPERILLVKGKVTVREGQASVACDLATDDIQQDVPRDYVASAPLTLGQPPAWLPEMDEEAPTGPSDLPTLPPEAPAPGPKAEPASHAARATGNGPRRLHITLRGSVDHTEDRRVLRELVDLLHSRPGPDQFTLFYETEPFGYQLDFPNVSTEISDGLLAELKRSFPDARTRVEPIAGESQGDSPSTGRLNTIRP
jgi:DNA polymerase-3 subunit alpha